MDVTSDYLPSKQVQGTGWTSNLECSGLDGNMACGLKFARADFVKKFVAPHTIRIAPAANLLIKIPNEPRPSASKQGAVVDVRCNGVCTLYRGRKLNE